MKANSPTRRLLSGATSISALALGLALPATAHGQDTWTGTTSSDWTDGSNWVDGTAPTASEFVTIDSTAPNPAEVDGTSAAATDLLVGDSGIGTLNVLNGGTLGSTNGYLGYFPGASGRLTVDGAGSLWTTSNALVGYSGLGRLDIVNGGRVDANAVRIGIEAGSFGTVLVDGSGSILDAAGGTLEVGRSGTGSLVVTNGGRVDYTLANDLVIGANGGSSGTVRVDGAGSVIDAGGSNLLLRRGSILVSGGGQILNHRSQADGDVTVTGAGSAWINSGFLLLGYDHDATLTVRDGGLVQAAGLAIGDGAERGSVLVDGAGSRIESSIYVAVSNGDMAISNGGAVSSLNGLIGTSVGESGSVTVDGAGSNWTMSDELEIGYNGTGHLEIRNGGVVNNQIGLIGINAGSVGIAEVTGAGSTWNNSDALYVGHSGTGALNISNGGLVTSTAGFIGNNPGSVGSAVVFGTGSLWSMPGALRVGVGGEGVLFIAAGGRVESGSGVVGSSTGSSGSAIIAGTGSAWTNTGLLTIGQVGSGALTINTGGTVNSNGGEIGAAAGSLGEVTVTGNGSIWNNNGGDLKIGVGGEGRLKVLDGATVNSFGGVVGVHAGSEGWVDVEGVDSRWQISDSLVVGESGQGVVAIRDGGRVIGLNSVLGANAGSLGQVTVDGAGSLFETHLGLAVGSLGTGFVVASNGGAISSDTAVVGSGQGSPGTVILDGAGTNWVNTAAMLIGGSGTGHVRINRGASLTSGQVSLGETASGIGSLTIGDAGSGLVVGGDLIVGHGGYGAMAVTRGASVSASNITLARSVGSSAVVELEDAGTRLTVSNRLTVGDLGQAQLNVRSGAQVESATGILGGLTGGRGEVLVTDAGSQWTNSGLLVVGTQATGLLTIANGGTVTTSTAELGTSTGVRGDAVIDGTGSNLQASGNLALGTAGTGTITVRNGGTLNVGGTLRIATNAGSSGALIIGADFDQAAAAAGTVNANDIRFGAGDGRIEFNHTGTAYVFGGSISGQGNISFTSGTTILTGNSSGFGGQAALNGGTLVVNGSFGEVLSVDVPGRLMGTGTIGKVMVFGTIAPGNSIGTLNVGDISFGAGSTYEVELTPAGLSDRIAATGNVTINGGTVRVMNPVGTYALGSRYTIVAADGTVTGTYSGLSMLNPLQTPFLTFGLSYAPKEVYLDVLRSSVTFASVGQSANQKATGAGLDSLPQSGPLIGALVQLTGPQAAQALDQLSGEIHASARTALIEDSRLVRSAMGGRMRTAEDQGSMLWASGLGSSGHNDGDGNAARLNRSMGGGLIGFDGRVADGWRMGLLGGWSRSNFSTPTLAAEGHANSVHLGGYANGQLGQLNLRLGAAHSWHKLHTTRQADFPGFSDSLTGSYNARTLQGFAELSHVFKTGKLDLEPYAQIAMVSHHTDDLSESGGSAALNGQEHGETRTFGTLGLRTTIGFGQDGKGGSFTLGTGWRHAFGSNQPLASLHFTGSAPFTIAGAPVAADVADLEAGLSFNLGRNMRIGLSYGGQFGSGVSDQSGRAMLSLRF